MWSSAQTNPGIASISSFIGGLFFHREALKVLEDLED